MVLLVGAVVVVGWRWVGDASAESTGGDEVSQLGPAETTIPMSSPEQRPASTTVAPRPSSPQPMPTTIPATTSTLQAGQRVTIRGEMKPCRFGANCLVASFTIDGFDEHPGSFVCIYPNSSTELSFGSDGVDDACVTADEGDTITIEVGGVRSATISETALDGE